MTEPGQEKKNAPRGVFSSHPHLTYGQNVRYMIYFSRAGRIVADTVGRDRGKWNEYDPVYVGRDLLDAAKWIVAEGLKGEK